MATSGYVEENKSEPDQFTVVSINTEGMPRSIVLQLPKMPFVDQPLTVTFTINQQVFEAIKSSENNNFSRIFNEGATLQISPEGFLAPYVDKMKPVIDVCTIEETTGKFAMLFQKPFPPIFNAQGQLDKAIPFPDNSEAINAVLNVLRLITTIANSLVLTIMKNPAFLKDEKGDYFDLLKKAGNLEWRLQDAILQPIFQFSIKDGMGRKSSSDSDEMIFFQTYISRLVIIQSEIYKSLLEKFQLNFDELKKQFDNIKNNRNIDSKQIDELWKLNIKLDELLANTFLRDDVIVKELRNLKEKLWNEIIQFLGTPREPDFLDVTTEYKNTYDVYLTRVITAQDEILKHDNPLSEDNALSANMGMFKGQFRPITIAELTKDDALTDDGEFHFKNIRYPLQQDATKKFTLSNGGDFTSFTTAKQERVLQDTVAQLEREIEKKEMKGGSTLCMTAAWLTRNEESKKRRLHLRCMSLGDSNSYVIVYDGKGIVHDKSKRINTVLDKNPNIHREDGEPAVARALGDLDALIPQAFVKDFHKGQFFHSEDGIELEEGQSFTIVTTCDGPVEGLLTEADEVKFIGECVLESKDNLKALASSIVRKAALRSGDNMSGVIVGPNELKVDGDVSVSVIADGHNTGGENVSKYIAGNIQSRLIQEIENKKSLWKKFKEADRFDKFLIVFGGILAVAAIGTVVAALAGVPVLAGIGVGAGAIGNGLVAGASGIYGLFGGAALAVKSAVAIKIGVSVVSACLALPYIMRMRMAYKRYFLKIPSPSEAPSGAGKEAPVLREGGGDVSGKSFSSNRQRMPECMGTAPHAQESGTDTEEVDSSEASKSNSKVALSPSRSPSESPPSPKSPK